MRIKQYPVKALALTWTISCCLSMFAAARNPVSVERFDLNADSGTYSQHAESVKLRSEKRSTPLSSVKHNFVISTGQESYIVKAAGRQQNYGISSSAAVPTTTQLSSALPPKSSSTQANGQGSTVPLAPPTVTTALSNNSGTSTITSQTSQIEVHLKCNIDATFCNKVANAFGSAILELGKVLQVKNKIIIDASYYNFCDNQCRNTTYGWALPSSQYTLPNLNGVDPNYLYPQALAKQLSPYNSTQWSSEGGQIYDISAEFNHDAYLSGLEQKSTISANGTMVPTGGLFWFQGDPSIGPEQIDMEYIILHELIHGLGFLSSWGIYFLGPDSPYFPSVQGLIDTASLQIVTLNPNSYTDSKTGAVYLTGFMAGMIFDKFVTANATVGNHSQSLAVIGDNFQSFCVQNDEAYVVNFINQFDKTDYASDADYLYQLMNTNHGLGFNMSSLSTTNLYSSGQLLPPNNLGLYTTYNATNIEASRGNFKPGLTISHFDDSYLTTPDFLMCHSYQTGMTMQDITAQVYDNSAAIYYNTTQNGTVAQTAYNYTIGPGILNILNIMGYGTITNNASYPAAFSSDKQFEPKTRNGCSSKGSSGYSQQSIGNSWKYGCPSWALIASASFWTILALCTSSTLLVGSI